MGQPFSVVVKIILKLYSRRGGGAPRTSAGALSLELTLPGHPEKLRSTLLASNGQATVGCPSVTGSSGVEHVRRHPCHVLAQPPQFTNLGLSLARYPFTECLPGLFLVSGQGRGGRQRPWA